jgi:predicted ester cyclase
MNQIKQLEYALDQLFVQGNLDIIDSVFHESYIAHEGNKSYSGLKFVEQYIRKLRKAIPDIIIRKLEFLSQSENYISWQRSFSGTHKAALHGIPASGKKVKWNEIVVTRFEGEKIAEDWLVSDLAFQLMLKHSKVK